MALAVEQFTAPGKFYIDSFFEEMERNLKKNYNNYSIAENYSKKCNCNCGRKKNLEKKAGID